MTFELIERGERLDSDHDDECTVAHPVHAGPTAPRARERPPENIKEEPQAVPLVPDHAAHRQDRARRIPVEHLRIRRGTALRIDDPSLRGLLSPVPFHPDLALCGHTHRHVEHKRLPAGGQRDGDRIRRDPPIDSAPGRGEPTRAVIVHGHHPDHIPLGRKRRILPDPAHVIAVTNPHGADRVPRGLLDSDLHRPGRGHLSEPPVSVQNGRGGGLTDHLRPRARTDIPRSDIPYVTRDPDDPVGIVSHEIGGHEMSRNHRGLLVRGARGPENIHPDLDQSVCVEYGHTSILS